MIKSALLHRSLLASLVIGSAALTPSLMAAPPVAQSSDTSKYAAIVVDAASGEVLFQRYADERRYPASITKVMTLYLVFEALEAGKVKLNDTLVISPRAASAPPSKLGLAAGQTISLDDAMRATAIRSANDMAIALAEHVARSEGDFTSRMTSKARELGMQNTRFTTANGLPDSRQTTTASDLAILSRAVMRDYPQYYRYLGMHDWHFNGRDYRNTNGLLNTGRGYDGIKTGFTNASGYNLAASSVRDGKRLITIVMGGRSTASRNAHVAELMDTGFEIERRRNGGEPIQTAQAFFEQRGFGIDTSPAPVAYASNNTNANNDGGVPYGSSANFVSGNAPAQLPTEITPAPSARTSAPSRRASTPTQSGRWAVQVGAFREETVARDWLKDVSRRFRSEFRTAEQDVQNANGWYRSRFTGLTETAAEGACKTLSERRVTCMVVRPS